MASEGFDLSDDDVGKARDSLHSDEVVGLGLAKIGVDQEDPVLAGGQGQGQVHRGERLAFARRRAGDDEDPRAGVRPAILERGPDDAIALDEGPFGTRVRSHPVGLGPGLVLGDDTQQGGPEVEAHVVGSLEGVVEVLEEKAQAHAKEGPQEDPERDVTHGAGADGSLGDRGRVDDADVRGSQLRGDVGLLPPGEEAGEHLLGRVELALLGVVGAGASLEIERFLLGRLQGVGDAGLLGRGGLEVVLGGPDDTLGLRCESWLRVSSIWFWSFKTSGCCSR